MPPVDQFLLFTIMREIWLMRILICIRLYMYMHTCKEDKAYNQNTVNTGLYDQDHLAPGQSCSRQLHTESR